MAVREIVKYPNDVLTTPCQKIDLGVTIPMEEMFDLAKDMRDTLETEKNGVALAANQIGHPFRIVALSKEFIEKKGVSYHPIIINPVITRHGSDKETEEEGCLSFPGVRLPVPRWRKITLEYQDILGHRWTIVATRFWARVFQHEIDHLDGILFQDVR